MIFRLFGWWGILWNLYFQTSPVPKCCFDMLWPSLTSPLSADCMPTDGVYKGAASLRRYVRDVLGHFFGIGHELSSKMCDGPMECAIMLDLWHIPTVPTPNKRKLYIKLEKKLDNTSRPEKTCHTEIDRIKHPPSTTLLHNRVTLTTHKGCAMLCVACEWNWARGNPSFATLKMW